MQRGLSHGAQSLSSPSPEALRAWRLFFENALALIDIMERDHESEMGIPIRFYDVLVHLEEAPDGLRMNELADKILYSKSGFTRVIDAMEKAGLVRRVVPEADRRSILVQLTADGRRTMENARSIHRHWIEDHFTSHLSDADIRALIRALEKVNSHTRTLRPGRISG